MARPERHKHHQGMSTSIPAADPTVRLRLATRIHFALLRHCGEPVGVSALLKGGDEAREALWVCQASGQAELVSLAMEFMNSASAGSAVSPAAVRQAAPQDAVWAQDTSGFGVSRPAGDHEPAARVHDQADTPARAPSGWLNPAHWLRRHAGR